jgi:hypothetical protein
MADGLRDAEQDIRRQLAEQARGEAQLLRSGSITTPNASVHKLIDKAHGSPERLRDAAALLGEEDQEALALLTRAHRLAQFPVQDPSPPKPFSPPNAPRP